MRLNEWTSVNLQLKLFDSQYIHWGPHVVSEPQRKVSFRDRRQRLCSAVRSADDWLISLWNHFDLWIYFGISVCGLFLLFFHIRVKKDIELKYFIKNFWPAELGSFGRCWGVHACPCVHTDVQKHCSMCLFWWDLEEPLTCHCFRVTLPSDG